MPRANYHFDSVRSGNVREHSPRNRDRRLEPDKDSDKRLKFRPDSAVPQSCASRAPKEWECLFTHCSYFHYMAVTFGL